MSADPAADGAAAADDGRRDPGGVRAPSGEAPPAEEADPFAGGASVLGARSPLAKRLLFTWRHRFTPGGRALTVVLVGTGSVSTGLGPHFPSYQLGLFLLAALVVSWVAGLVLRPRVAVARRLPERCAAGAAVRVAARVTNQGRLPVYDLGLRETSWPPLLDLDPEPEVLPRLGPGETVELTYEVRPTRRGAYDLPGPQAFTAFPFGLGSVTRNLAAPHRLLASPRFAPLARLEVPAGRRHQPGGLQLVSQVGDSEEFIGNREYRAGDRLRDVDHRAWARVGAPIVREFQQEYLTRIALVVDTWRPRETRRARRELEAAISLGAAVADALSRQEYVVDVFAAGPELYHFQAGRSLAYLDDILDVLACIEPCPTNPFTELGPAIQGELDRISTAVVLLLDWDDDRLAFVRHLGERGVAVKAVVVRDLPPTRDPAGGSAGAPVTALTPAEVARGVERL